ncbi:MAG: hypothetical protein AB1483_13325 [Candidatus Zixiibacteriota bacterium]
MHSPEHKRKEAEDLFNRGVALYESDKYSAAIEIFQSLLVECDDCIDMAVILSWIGCCFHESKQYTAALKHFQKRIDLVDWSRPRHGDVYTLYRMAMAHAFLDQNDKVLECLNEAERYFYVYEEPEPGAEEGNPRFEIKLLKGYLYTWQDEPLRAIKEFEAAYDYLESGSFKRSEDEAEVLYCLGFSHMDADDPEKAAEYFQKLNPAHLHQDLHESYNVYMVGVCVYQQRWADALKDFAAAKQIGIRPSLLSRAYDFAGMAYFHLGDGENARVCFETALKYEAPEWLKNRNRDYLAKVSKEEG